MKPTRVIIAYSLVALIASLSFAFWKLGVERAKVYSITSENQTITVNQLARNRCYCSGRRVDTGQEVTFYGPVVIEEQSK